PVLVSPVAVLVAPLAPVDAVLVMVAMPVLPELLAPPAPMEPEEPPVVPPVVAVAALLLETVLLELVVDELVTVPVTPPPVVMVAAGCWGSSELQATAATRGSANQGATVECTRKLWRGMFDPPFLGAVVASGRSP